MFYALLLATSSAPLVGGLPLPYADILCETGAKETVEGRPGFVLRQLRNFPLEDRLAVVNYCIGFNRGKSAELRRAELPESTD